MFVGMMRWDPGLVEEMIVELWLVGYEMIDSEVESGHDLVVDEAPISEVESEEDSLVSSSLQSHHPHPSPNLEL
jgi:hypothetical protein